MIQKLPNQPVPPLATSQAAASKTEVSQSAFAPATVYVPSEQTSHKHPANKNPANNMADTKPTSPKDPHITDQHIKEQHTQDALMQESVPNSRSFRKLQKKLRKEVSHAIRDYGMIEDGDKVMVCLSGGKDSYTMLDILLFLQKVAPIHFEIVAVNLDQKQPGFPEDVLPSYLTQRGVPHYILEKDTYSITKKLTPEGKTYCAVCSRLRRGSLYGFADEIGATKVALGHHRDDMIATFFLNIFHGGKLKAMPPKLRSDDGKNILIRPLIYVAEKDIIRYAQLKEFPIIPCNLCGSQENLQRAKINDMLREWDTAHPKRLASIAAALGNVAPSQLADTHLFDFMSLVADNATLQTHTADTKNNNASSKIDVVNVPFA